MEDLNLLAPTLSGLKILIDVCHKYAKEFNIKFNESKSRLLLFKGRSCKISTRGVTVNSVSAVHFGHHMSTKDKNVLLMQPKIVFGDILICSYLIMVISTLFFLNELFKQYCCSYYLSPLWPLQSDRFSLSVLPGERH